MFQERAITRDFIASIRENGVITPILARRDDHGNVIVRAGQRRTLVAREAEVSTVPVYVVEGDDTAADRTIQQIIENDQRADLSTADCTAAWAQLAFEGISAAQIAKRTGTKTDAVKKGLAVAESAAVTSALHEHELTLGQAAVLLEFEDDADARAHLIEVATTDPTQFEHTAQSLRDDAMISPHPHMRWAPWAQKPSSPPPYAPTCNTVRWNGTATAASTDSTRAPVAKR